MQQYPNQIDFLPDAQLRTFEYPVMQYPAKVTSHNLDKTPQVSGVLLGIKGQYLILDSGVINLRKYSGYKMTVASAS